MAVSGVSPRLWLIISIDHRPGTLRSYFVIATQKSDGTPEDDRRVQETLEFAQALEISVVDQDVEILNTIRFTRGPHFRKSFPN